MKPGTPNTTQTATNGQKHGSTRLGEARAALEAARRQWNRGSTVGAATPSSKAPELWTDDGGAPTGDQRPTAVGPALVLDAAAVERDEAIARMEDTYRGDLLRELDRRLEELAQARAELDVDDFRDSLVDLPGIDGIDLRCLGSVFTRAARRGVLEAVGYTPSRRRHKSPLRLWRSLVVLP
jgi:hypothetical protein